MQGAELIENTKAFGEAIPIADSFNMVLWSLMLFNVVSIALVKSLNVGYLQNIFLIIIYNKHLTSSLREELNFGRPSSVLLNITYFNSLAIVIWEIYGSENELFILAFLGGLIGLAITKLLLIRIIGYLLNSTAGLQEHLLGHFIFFQAGGIILTPLIIFTHFLPSAYFNVIIWTLIGFIIIFILLREIQSFVRAFLHNIPIFYIILYLCTLEILPIVVGFRVFVPINGALN